MPLLQTPGPAPDFATHAVVNGNIGHIGLKDYQGEKYVLLVFYPMDFVYAESIIPFSNRVDDFKKLNCEVLAMSTDSVYSHKAFVKASKADGGLEGRCKIPLLADRSGKISKKYGVFDAEEGIARKALVVIDDRGTARHMVASSLPVDRIIDDTLKVITSFQSKSLSSGAGGDVMPSNFPIIKSTHSLVAKHVTREKWEKLKNVKTKTSGFTLWKAIAVSVEFDNQHCGIYAGDWDSYKDFAIVFDPLIQEYHGILPSATHTSDMDINKIKGNVGSDVPVHSVRIRVGRSIDGFGLSPGITKEQRKGVEALMKNAVKNFKGDLQGQYYPLTGMEEKVRQQLVDDHFLFVSGDRNLQVAGMERDWPEGRGIFHNAAKTFLIWVNEEDQLRIISMQKGGDVKAVFERLAKGIKAVQESVKKESGKDFCLDKKYGYIHSCPTNLGTGMRASCHVDLPGWTKCGLPALQKRCEELHLQPRGTRGESGGQTGHTYDISNKHRLGYSEVELVQKMIDGVNTLWKEDQAFMAGAPAPAQASSGSYKAMEAKINGPFPNIQSKHSLVAKFVTKDKWEQLKGIKTKTSGFTLIQAIACAVEFDNQHCGIYAGDWDSYKDFAPVFDPLIQEYHGIKPGAKHSSDMDASKIRGNVESDVPVHSCRIRVGRSIDGFGLSPGITKQQRVGVESLMKNAVKNFPSDLAGQYYPLTGMNESVRQQLVDDHFLFVSGDRNLTVAGMERDWPEGRGIFHNAAKTFLIWVNEEDQLRIISMQKGGDVKAVFERLAKGIKAVQDSVKKESGKDFCLSEKYGYIHSCPTNLGTGMRASVHVDLPGWTAHSVDKLKARCEELHLQPRGTRGESGGQTGHTYDISNKHRLGYSEVELVQKMIDGVNTLWKEDKALQSGGSAYKAMEAQVNGPFPNIQSKHSLVAKFVTKDKWEQLKGIKTKTSGFTLIQAIACAVEFDNQHCGIYAGDWDSYKDFAPVFDPLIQEYHGIKPGAKHTSDMDASKIKGNVASDVPVHSCRIRVGRSIDGFGLSPGITKEQRVGVENLMKNAVKNFPSDLAGQYYPLTGMQESVRQQLVDDHFLFVSGDRNLTVAGMERDWPEGRGIFHNANKTFLIWVNEEDQLRIISMQKGGDVKAVFERLAKGIKAVQDSVKKESGKDFCLSEKFGYIHSCPTNLGTGMRASVHVDLPGWTAHSVDKLKARCEELHLQPRGTRGESGGQTGHTYDISNKHRLGYSEVELVQKMIDGVNALWKEDKALQAGGTYKAMEAQVNGPFPNIKSTHSLVAKHVTKDKWEALKGIKTKTSGFTLIQAIACAVEFDNQHCGIYAGDWDSYKDFGPVFDPLIQEYHGISADARHTSDMDATKIKGNVAEDVPVHSCRIRVGRSIDGFGLSPGITKQQRVGVESLMKNAVKNFPKDLAGQYYPLTGMNESVRQQLVDDHFLFVSGDRNLTVAGMERDWPEGRGIFHNAAKTFLIWVNEEDQLRIISMQMGGDVRAVFERLAKGIKAVQDSVKKESGKDFCLSEKYGYIHSCPTNLGTGMRASVHVDLPGWTEHGVAKLQARCEELQLQPRGTRGESGGQTGFTYDISNKHRLGYSEVELVQKMIDGVNTLWKEDKEHQKKYFGDFPFIASQHSLVAKHVTKAKWDQLKNITTKTSGFTLAKAIACAVTFNNQHCGIYAGDWDSYKDFAPVFDPLIQEYHGISSSAKHTSDMDVNKIKGNVVSDAPVHSTRIRVGRSIDGFGLSPGITKEQRLGVEALMKNAIKNFPGDLAGEYYPLTGMPENVRQQLVDDHFLFVSGDRNLTVAGMERDWPEGRGIFHNAAKTFLIWVNEEDQLRIISMENGGNVKGVFERLALGIKTVQDSVKKESGKDFCLDEKYGYVHSCPTNLGTGMRASVHIDLPGWTKHSVDKLKARCEELHLQPRGTRGESGGQTGHTYDISNKHRLGYSEVELVQKMIDGVNTLWKEDKEFQ